MKADYNTSVSSYFSMKDLEKIEKYLAANLDTMKKNYREFMPIVCPKIEQICKKWFEEVQKQAKSGNFSAKLPNNYSTNLDKQAVELVMDIFTTRYNLILKNASIEEEESGINSLCNVLPGGRLYSFNCFWPPSNAQVYGAADAILKRYQDVPSPNERMLENARNGEDTDIKLKSLEGDEISAHSLFLKAKSPVFKAMLNSTLKESHEGVIKLPCSTLTITFLLQFIYEGRIEPFPYLHPSHLELLELAHRYDILSPNGKDNLFNYCVDLINDYFNKCYSEKLIIDIINKAFIYDLKEFLVPCLKRAERLDSREFNMTTKDLLNLLMGNRETNIDILELHEQLKSDPDNEDLRAKAKEILKVKYAMDFSQVDKSHYAELLSLAAKLSLSRVEAKLTALINHYISPDQNCDEGQTGEKEQEVKESSKGKEKEEEVKIS